MAAMSRQNAGPTTMEEAMTEPQRDVIAVLTHDHREVEQMFAELESLRGATGEAQRARRKDLVDQVTIELVRHSVAEEAEVYPAVKEKVSNAEAERALEEHAEAEETMKRLEGLQPDDPSFDQELATLMTEIRAHVAEEEGEMFPHMRRVFSEEELVELGRKVEAVKKMAPTRPHPSAPDEPPGDKILGPITGLLDRMRDAVTRRGTQE
jgi:hemerythrin superfamily protein